MRIKNWLITKLLEKDKLVCVPQSWQNDYVKLAAEKVHNKEVIAMLVTEYNGLLQDYYNKLSKEELKTELAECELDLTDKTQAELATIAYEEFRMTIEKD